MLPAWHREDWYVPKDNRRDSAVKVSPDPQETESPGEPHPDARRPWTTRVHPDFLDARKTPMSDRARYVFQVLDGCCRDKPYCWYGNESLIDLTGKPERS